MVDEFQYLFAERDAVSREATTLLEDVSRRGRSQGIHLVLASQDVSGIEAFWGRPAIFEQFVLRMALPRSRRVLADFNEAALDLPRWHAVINHESGIRHGNEVARIPDATARGTVDTLQAQLWRRAADRTAAAPAVRRRARRPGLPDADRRPLPARPPAPVAVLGQVIDVAGSPARLRLPDGPGRNLAVLGTQVADAARGARRGRALGRPPRSSRAPRGSRSPRWPRRPPSRPATWRAGCAPTATRSRRSGLADVGSHLDQAAATVRDRLTATAGPGQRSYLVLYAVDGAESVLGQGRARRDAHSAARRPGDRCPRPRRGGAGWRG